MKRLVLLIVMFAAVSLYAQNKGEEEVKEAGDNNIQAILHGDVSTLAKQYTDDYFRTGEKGKVTGKAEILKLAGDPKTRPTNAELSDRKIRVFGDVAVETGLNKATYQRDGKSEVRQTRYTVVWRKENGTWKKAVYQATSVTP